MEETKFCKYCGEKIPMDAVICTKCGRQVEKMEGGRDGNIVINNVSNSSSSASATAVAAGYGHRMVNKWVALVLCIVLGIVGGHKFYEGKIGMGILYFFTMGLFFIGVIVDFITILMKPNPYAV